MINILLPPVDFSARLRISDCNAAARLPELPEEDDKVVVVDSSPVLIDSVDTVDNRLTDLQSTAWWPPRRSVPPPLLAAALLIVAGSTSAAAIVKSWRLVERPRLASVWLRKVLRSSSSCK